MTAMNKIDRPPTAENWARMQHPDVEKTAFAMFNFLRGTPMWNYDPAKVAAQCRIEDQIPRQMAEEIVRRSKNKLGKPFNLELIRAFLDFEEKNPINGVKAFDHFSEWFPLNRSVSIPVKPLTVIRENGAFTPIFLCPWSRVTFDFYQRKLLMTILEEAVFRHTDFENSVGKVLFFPKTKMDDGSVKRSPMVWERGQTPLLSKAELNDQIGIFFAGKQRANILYQEYIRKRSTE